MLARALRSRGVARVAVAALTLGLSALVGLAMFGTVSTARTTSQVRANGTVAEHWDDVLLRVSNEYEALVDYLRANTDVGRQPLVSALGSADPSLAWLARHGGAREAGQTVEIQYVYDAYTGTLRRLISARELGASRQVGLLAEQATLSAAALRKLVVANTARKRLEIKLYLAEVDGGNRNLRLAAGILGGVDFLLLLLCGSVLLTYQRHTERQAVDSRHRSLHDALTGIANRALLHDHIELALDQAGRHGELVALLLLDLNRFKEVNDTLGHHHGDLVLREVAARLTQTTRAGDTVARLGGDEFAVLIPRVADVAAVTEMADRVLAALQRPAQLDGTVIDISASIGAAIHPTHSLDSAELLRHADIAMYTAKRGHLGTAIYDPGTDHNTSTDQLSVLSELRQGLDRGEVVLHYQPKAHAHTGSIAGVEALARWQHPRRGLLGPAEFVGLAEQSDLIGPLTDTVLTTALRQYCAWRDAGAILPVAVNVAAPQLLDHSFPDRVAALLDRFGSTPGDLTLEITESTVIADPPRAMAVLGRLHDLGVRISIDDFGTGHSSMSYLQRMPLDELKVDRQFVSGLRTSAADLAIVQAILDLAHALRLQVVAEGVEGPADLGRARRDGLRHDPGVPPGPADARRRGTRLARRPGSPGRQPLTRRRPGGRWPVAGPKPG